MPERDRESTEPMKWHYFKLHTEARNDAKLRALGDRQFRVWFRLLCFAAEQPEPGEIVGLNELLVAAECSDGNLELLRETVDALGALHCTSHRYHGPKGVGRKLDLLFVKFKERQHQKPSDTSERVRDRVRKHRDNKKLQPIEGGVTGAVTPPDGNAVVTPGNAPGNAPVTTIELLTKSYQRTPLPPEGEPVRPSVPEPIGEDHEGCVILAAELFGDQAGNAVSRLRDDIAATVTDEHDRPRWDCYAAALKLAKRLRDEGTTINKLHPFCLSKAREWAVVGIPPEPIRVEGKAAPAQPPRPTHVAAADSPFRRANEAARRREAEAGGVK